MAEKHAKVFHYDLYGKREEKYNFLDNNSVNSIDWQELEIQKPNFFFVYKDTTGQKEYEKGFLINELFRVNGTGIKFRKDNLLIKNNFSFSEVEQMLHDMNLLSSNDLQIKYNFKETSDWLICEKKELFRNFSINDIEIATYRPFDSRFTYYPLDRISQIIVRGDSRKNLMQNLLRKNGSNLALIVTRLNRALSISYFFVVNKICDIHLLDSSSDSLIVCPLYLYPDNSQQSLDKNPKRVPNFNPEIVNRIAEKLNLTFINEKEIGENIFAPIDLLDYIYGVLYSPTYREKYKEFLKIDFPRVPYPKNRETFWKLVELGGEIRKIHLLESSVVEKYITQYPIDGDNIISRKITKASPGYVPVTENCGRVYVNDNQYFDNVPLIAWNFFIGGYQPAQKWLKDREGRKLDFDDILHYQKIIMALNETDRIMKEIDHFFER